MDKSFSFTFEKQSVFREIPFAIVLWNVDFHG